MSAAYNSYLLAADAILLLHFAFVIFVVFGFVLIWIGHYAKWRFVRNLKFRFCHILAIGIVFCESLVGMICPFTEWENALRVKGGAGRAYETSFMGEWIHKILYYEFSELTFVIVYGFFLVLILLTFWLIPPEWTFKGRKQKS